MGATVGAADGASVGAAAVVVCTAAATVVSAPPVELSLEQLPNLRYRSDCDVVSPVRHSIAEYDLPTQPMQGTPDTMSDTCAYQTAHLIRVHETCFSRGGFPVRGATVTKEWVGGGLRGVHHSPPARAVAVNGALDSGAWIGCCGCVVSGESAGLWGPKSRHQRVCCGANTCCRKRWVGRLLGCVLTNTSIQCEQHGYSSHAPARHHSRSWCSELLSGVTAENSIFGRTSVTEAQFTFESVGVT